MGFEFSTWLPNELCAAEWNVWVSEKMGSDVMLNMMNSECTVRWANSRLKDGYNQ